ncbi:hypothetical protein H5410_026126 [Solanum commersonii]|uniref:Uncharacterized protein n=1 Tax=Solanum commersonii TaxID=4109 RepID=A0A9J5YW56_SOLCO|nr:hypothetical protein H5410_026126 [Solanum commersonii]
MTNDVFKVTIQPPDWDRNSSPWLVIWYVHILDPHHQNQYMNEQTSRSRGVWGASLLQYQKQKTRVKQSTTKE